MRSAVVAQSESLTATIIASVTQIVALVVGFGIINSTQEGIIISLTTAGVSLGGLIAHGIHTGKVNPTGLQTYVLAVVAQAVALAVSFAIIGESTAATIVSITVAVVAIGVQLAHALISQQTAA